MASADSEGDLFELVGLAGPFVKSQNNCMNLASLISREVVAKVPSKPASTANIMIVSKFCIRSECNPKRACFNNTHLLFYILV